MSRGVAILLSVSIPRLHGDKHGIKYGKASSCLRMTRHKRHHMANGSINLLVHLPGVGLIKASLLLGHSVRTYLVLVISSLDLRERFSGYKLH